MARAAEFVGNKVPPSAETALGTAAKTACGGIPQSKCSCNPLFGFKLILVMGPSRCSCSRSRFNSQLTFLMRFFMAGISIFAAYRLPDFTFWQSGLLEASRTQLRRRACRMPSISLLSVLRPDSRLIAPFRNVSQQLSFVHPAICEEFSLFTAEIGAGLRRKEALENIARNPDSGNRGPQVRRGTCSGRPVRHQHGRCTAHPCRVSADPSPPDSGRNGFQSRREAHLPYLFLHHALYAAGDDGSSPHYRAATSKRIVWGSTIVPETATGVFIDYYELMQISPKAQQETIQRVYPHPCGSMPSR